MPLFRSVMGVMVIGLLASNGVAQPVTDLAKLFPADTLAYAEIAKPGAFVTGVKALVAGTPWADASKLLHDRYDGAPDLGQANAVRETALLTLFTSPEFLAEVTRFTGAAVAFTGYDAHQNPRYAAAILLGDSNATGLAIRLFLTTSSDVRRVGVVDGIPIYQHRTFAGQPLDPGQAAIAEPKNELWPEGKAEVTYAYTPGLFIIGSGRDAIADVLRRYQGKSKDASLAQSELFRGQQAARDRTGVFLYATPTNWLAQYDAANKAAVAKAETDLTAIIRFVANPKSIPVVTATFSLDADRVELSGEIVRDPKLPNPLASLLIGSRVTADHFKSLPGPPHAAVTVSLPSGEQRVKSALTVADAIACAWGVIGKKPSERIAALEQDTGKDTGKDTGRKTPTELLATIKAVTVFTPASTTPSPVVMLHLETARDADRWRKELPTLLPLLLTGEPPVSELASGVRVYTMLTGTGDTKTAWQFSVTTTTVMIHQDKKVTKVGKGTRAEWNEWLSKVPVQPDTTALGFFNVGGLLEHCFTTPLPVPEPIADGPIPNQGAVPIPPRPGLPLGFIDDINPIQMNPQFMSPLDAAMSRALKHLPTLSVQLTTKVDRMPFVVQVPNAKKSLGNMLMKLLEPPPIPKDSDESKPVPKELR